MISVWTLLSMLTSNDCAGLAISFGWSEMLLRETCIWCRDLRKSAKKPTFFALHHTCIIGHYNGNQAVLRKAAHTTHIVYVNFIHEWRDLQFNVDSERLIFEKIFMAGLFTLRVFARNLQKGNRRRMFFFFFRLRFEIGLYV